LASGSKIQENDDDFNKVDDNGRVATHESNAVVEKAEEETIEAERLPIGDDYYVIAFCSTLNKAK
jgi:hypothetical protein